MDTNGYLKAVLIGIALLPLVDPVVAEEQLSAEEVKKLYTDKTFDGKNELAADNYRVYSSADGTMKVVYSNGQSKTLNWRVDKKGRHCISKNEGGRDKCSKIVSMGDGVYKKITNGQHVHTMRNFVDGNHL